MYLSINCVNTCDFSPNGELLAVGDDDNKLTVYHLASEAKQHVFEHKDYVNTCNFSPNGELLAVGGDDNKLTVYHLASEVKQHVFEHKDYVQLLTEW